MIAAALIGPRSGLWYPVVLLAGLGALAVIAGFLTLLVDATHRDQYPEITARRNAERELRRQTEQRNR